MADQEILNSLTDAVGGMLAAECTIDDVLKFASAGSPLYDSLKQQAAELGWLGMAAPEAAGGSDLGIAALASIYAELGSHLAPLPFLGQQLCIDALAAADRAADQRLAALAGGTAWGTCTWSPSNAVEVSGDHRIRSAALPLFDAGDSSFALVFARLADQAPAVLLLDIADAARGDFTTHDHTRPSQLVAIDGMAIGEDALLATGEAAVALKGRIIDHQSIGIAADCVGGARAALARTVDYMKTREQFGRPIGSFQALKHRAASMKLEVEAAAALLRLAVAEFGQGAKGSALASLARARAGSAYVKVAGEAIQLHGGIGFTSEYPAHLYLKRAKLNQSLAAGDRAALDRAATLLVRAAA